MIDEERFFAWLDGELDTDAAAEVAALVAADPDLRRKAEVHRKFGQRLHAAFDPVAAQGAPDRLLQAIRPREAEVIDLSARRASRPSWAPVEWAAMAATLAIGIVAGSLVNRGPTSPISSEGGQLVASGELEQALYTSLASAPADQGARIGLTFRDAKGDLCRSFSDDGASGLACHEKGDWRIRGLFQATEGQSSEFRMASGPDPRLGELIDATISGEPLDAAGERKALDGLR
jgi:hypothetical protein